MRSTVTGGRSIGFAPADAAVLDVAYRRIMARHPINCSVSHDEPIDRMELAEVEKNLEGAPS